MTTKTKPSHTEKTFRAFTPAAASRYAQHRHDYHPVLYATLLKRHTDTGGELDTLLDVGCGPGTAARSLGIHFKRVIGLDPSEGMITQAQELGGTSRDGDPIHFAVSCAEDMTAVLDGSVDLVIAAAAVHWFDVPAFWNRAAQVLKPGGSVGLWTHRAFRFADSVPNVAAIRAEVAALHSTHLAVYDRPGSLISRGLYVDLPMPWHANVCVPQFDQQTLYRMEWGTGTKDSLPGDQFLSGGQLEVDMDEFEATMGTTSTIVRWREDHPEKVGTEDDILRRLRRTIERLLNEAGVPQGKETIKGAEQGVLLVLKRN